MFSGYHQHDSQEFINYLLDGIHEDLNRVKVKPITEQIESNGQPDEDIANKSFAIHRKRNDSIIVDQLHGQYKSMVKCPNENCNKISITFDPFISLTTPVPVSNKKEVEIYVKLSDDYKYQKIQVNFLKNDNHKFKDLSSEINKTFNLPVTTKFHYMLRSSYFVEDYKESDKTKEVRKKFKYRTLLANIFEDEEYLKNEDDENSFRIQIKHCYNEEKGYYNKTLLQTFIDVNKKDPMNVIGRKIIKNLEKVFPNENIKLESALKSDNPLFTVNIETNSYYECKYCKKKCDGCLFPLFLADPIEKVYQDESVYKDFKLVINWKKDNSLNIDLTNIEKLFEISEKQEEQGQHQIVQHKLSIYDCLKEQSKPETLEEDNTWYCNKCKDHVQAIKKFEIYRASKYLIIHFKRFKEVKKYNGIGLSKIETLIDFPINNLDLSEFILNKKDVEGQTQNSNYELAGIVNHMGTINFGHYVAYCKNSQYNKWYSFNDSHVSEIQEEELVSNSAYILFYRRKEQLDQLHYNQNQILTYKYSQIKQEIIKNQILKE